MLKKPRLREEDKEGASEVKRSRKDDPLSLGSYLTLITETERAGMTWLYMGGERTMVARYRGVTNDVYILDLIRMHWRKDWLQDVEG